MFPETHRFARGLLLGVFAMVLVGGSVAVSEVLGDAPLFTAQAIRYGAAAALLLLLSRIAGVEIVRPRGHEWFWLVGIAATGLVLFNVAVVRGVVHAEPAAIAVAVACVPVVIGLIGPLLDGQRPARQVVMAAVVVTVGGIIVEGTGRTDAAGIAWALVTLVCEAAFTLLAIPVLRRQGAWGVSVHTVWIATIMLVVLGVLTEGARRRHASSCRPLGGDRVSRSARNRCRLCVLVLQRCDRRCRSGGPADRSRSPRRCYSGRTERRPAPRVAGLAWHGRRIRAPKCTC
jgi:drug/metabolite transporter (DMT)-like permease